MIWRIIGIIILALVLVGFYSVVTGDGENTCRSSQSVQCQYPK